MARPSRYSADLRARSCHPLPCRAAGRGYGLKHRFVPNRVSRTLNSGPIPARPVEIGSHRRSACRTAPGRAQSLTDPIRWAAEKRARADPAAPRSAIPSPDPRSTTGRPGRGRVVGRPVTRRTARRTPAHASDAARSPTAEEMPARHGSEDQPPDVFRAPAHRQDPSVLRDTDRRSALTNSCSAAAGTL
jgi:hypothetical protein